MVVHASKKSVLSISMWSPAGWRQRSGVELVMVKVQSSSVSGWVEV